jgi:hypothetical protein
MLAAIRFAYISLALIEAVIQNLDLIGKVDWLCDHARKDNGFHHGLLERTNGAR